MQDEGGVEGRLVGAAETRHTDLPSSWRRSIGQLDACLVLPAPQSLYLQLGKLHRISQYLGWDLSTLLLHVTKAERREQDNFYILYCRQSVYNIDMPHHLVLNRIRTI